MLNKIFTNYGNEKQGIKLINLSQILKFAKDFNLFDKSNELTQAKLEIIFSKYVSNKNYGNFKEFLEILFKISKILRSTKRPEKYLILKSFLLNHIEKHFKDIIFKQSENNLEKIQIFYKDFNDFENPTACLLYENDNLLKNVKKFS